MFYAYQSALFSMGSLVVRVKACHLSQAAFMVFLRYQVRGGLFLRRIIGLQFLTHFSGLIKAIYRFQIFRNQ